MRGFFGSVGIGAAFMPRLFEALHQSRAQGAQFIDLALLQVNLPVQLLHQVFLGRQLDFDLDQPLFRIHATPAIPFRERYCSLQARQRPDPGWAARSMPAIKGVPERGSRISTQLTPYSRSTSSDVTTSSGAPWAMMAPSSMATMWSA